MMPYTIELPTEADVAAYNQKYQDALKADDKKNAAKSLAQAIPQWAIWTEAEANTWYETNVRQPFAAATTLAAMKAVIGTMIQVQWASIRMILAMRDHLWPDLGN